MKNSAIRISAYMLWALIASWLSGDTYAANQPRADGDVSQGSSGEPVQPIGNVELLAGGKFMVDGEYFLPTGMLYDPKSTTAAFCKAHFINCLHVELSRTRDGVQRFEGLLREAEKVDLKILPYFSYGGWNEPNKEPPPWTAEQVRQYLKFRKSRAIIGWVVGDDLLCEKHIPGVKSTVEVLRQLDPGRPTLGNCDGRPPEDALPFRPFLDIMLPYGYPVATKSFEQYVHGLALRRRELGDPLWTWVQVFNTKPTLDTFHIGEWGPGPFPQPEQLRLLTFLPFTCGYRGILYFGGHTLSSNPERAAEMAICCAELSLIGEIIAGGNLSSRATMAATYCADELCTAAWEQSRRLLVIAMTRQSDAHRHVGEAVFKNFPIRVTLPGDRASPVDSGRSLEVHAVGFPELRQLPFSFHGQDSIDIQVDRLEVMEMILVSDKSDPLVNRIKAQVAEVLPVAAYFAVESATAELSKVQKTYEAIMASGGATSDAEAALAGAQKEKDTAAQALRSEQFASAFTHARGCLRHCRRAGAACLKDASDRAAKYGQTFYTLPEFYRRVRPIPPKRPE